VVTFNYDTVLEKLGPGLQIVLPGDEVDGKRVPVFKLHGSGDWAVDPSTGKVTRDPDAIKNGATIAIAAPGRSKTRTTSSTFEPLWTEAMKRLEDAYSVAIIGYGFPKTDAEARMKLLAALDREKTPTRWVELVLGPEIERSDVRRVFELVRRRLGRRETYENRWPNLDVAPPNLHYSMITQHRLWAEDFIGDYGRRTERPLSLTT
jgi:hypothetical protein